MPRYNNLRDDDYTGVAPPSGIATPGGAYTATATDSPAPTPNATAAPTDAAAAMPPAAAPQSETSEQSAPSFAARAAHWAKALIIGEAAAADELPTDVHGLISAALSHNVGPIYSGDGSDGEVPVLASQRRTKGTLGWFDGVWIPVVLNIWGVILFLRMGWLVGQAGILVGIVIITLANTITTLTTLSLSALCSSGEVKDGGAYYLISRALGPAYGGTIGVLLFLGQTVALAMYVIGFAESLYDYLQKLIGFDYLTVSDDVDVIVFGVVTMIAVLLISFVGIGFVQRMQTVLFGVLVVSFAAVAIGAFLPMLPNLTSNARRGFVGYWAILGDTAWADVPKDLIPKNRQPATVLSNMMPDFSTDPDTMISHDFFTVFSIIFPAVTGIMAGANLSGDLKNPGSAIPKGTLLGIVVAYIVYVGFVFIVGLTCIRCVGVGCPGVGQHADAAWARSVANTKFEPTGGLSYNKLIVADIAVWDGFVYLGCFAATLSSALASITGAPRILMRVARDGIFPCRACCKLFAKGYCVSDEPYVALALTFCIGTGCVLLGKIDLVAPIISNFFIMSYAITNYACFVVSRTRSTMFRPAFTWYNEWLSLFSAVLCIVVMVMMSVGMAIGSLVIGFVIFKLLQCIHQPHPGPGGEPKISWGGQVDNETTFVAALDAIAATQRVLPHARTFRPRFLVMSGSPYERPWLVKFVSSLHNASSLFIFGDVMLRDDMNAVTGDSDIDDVLRARRASELMWRADRLAGRAGVNHLESVDYTSEISEEEEEEFERAAHAAICAADSKPSHSLRRRTVKDPHGRKREHMSAFFDSAGFFSPTEKGNARGATLSTEPSSPELSQTAAVVAESFFADDDDASEAMQTRAKKRLDVLTQLRMTEARRKETLGYFYGNVSVWGGVEGCSPHPAFCQVVRHNSLLGGFASLLQTAGIGGMRPNVVALGYKRDWRVAPMDEVEEYESILSTTMASANGLVIVRDDERVLDRDIRRPTTIGEKLSAALDRARHKTKGLDGRAPIVIGAGGNNAMSAEQMRLGVIDVWWLDDDGGLTILIAHMLQRDHYYKKMRIRVCIPAQLAEEEMAAKKMRYLLELFRIDAEVCTIDAHLDDLNMGEVDEAPPRTRRARRATKTVEEVDALARLARERSADDFRISVDTSEVGSSAGVANPYPVTPRLQRLTRLGAVIQSHSINAAVVFVTMPRPGKSMRPREYTSWLEALSSNTMEVGHLPDGPSLPPMVFVYGTGQDALDLF